MRLVEKAKMKSKQELAIQPDHQKVKHKKIKIFYETQICLKNSPFTFSFIDQLCSMSQNEKMTNKLVI